VKAAVAASLALLTLQLAPLSSSWGNGGRSADSMNPDYGAHDWIAERASWMLPANESWFIFDNRARFLYATEIPDFVYDDQHDHHVYFHPDGRVMEDNAAVRAQAAYDELVSALRGANYLLGAEKAGVLTHYISDLAVFGHVLSSKTVWGAEKHHSDFESDVDDVLTGAQSSEFGAPFDGSLEKRGAWDAAVDLARNTTFGDLTLTARWLDDHYVAGGVAVWNATFRHRVESLIALAANLIAEVLHLAALDAALPPAPASVGPQVSTITLFSVLALLLLASAVLALLVRRRR
jgi:hypothetical protein